MLTTFDVIECCCEGEEKYCSCCGGTGYFIPLHSEEYTDEKYIVRLYEGLFEVSSLERFNLLLELSDVGYISKNSWGAELYHLVLFPLPEISPECPECLGQGYYEDDDWQGNAVKEPCAKCLSTGTHWHLLDEKEIESLPF